MYLPVLLLSLVWLPVTSPADLEHRIALAVAITADPGTTAHEARILMRIARWEGHYRADVSDCRKKGDSDHAIGPFQHWTFATDETPERARICGSLAEAALVARQDVRHSYHVCREYPEPERLRVYARGRDYKSDEAGRLSRTRWWP